MLGDVFPHSVINMPPGQNNFGMISRILGLVRQIIWINSDAMSANKPRPEREEIPLRFRPDGIRIDIHLVEQHGELVHESDIDIALGILDDFGRFRHPDAFRPVNACINNQLI